MWEYFTKEKNKEFILSLNLIKGNLSDSKKLNILYTISNHNEAFYTPHYIDKKDGTKRELLVPKRVLKNIQKNILKNVLNGLTVSEYATAYLPNKSLKENASPHINKKIILKLDIKNFFDNITFENIYNALSNSIFPPSIKVLLVKLCTYYDYLPQGAPTSPFISNLVLKNFDNYIGGYCKKRNISYTRFCDDLTFSGDFNPESLKNKVQAFIEEIGFNLNEKKTRIIKNNNLQLVTGLVVNKKLNVPKEYKRKIRQEMYYIKKYGMISHCKQIGVKKEKYILSLIGRINYCLQIDSENKEMKENLINLKQIKEG